MAKKNLESWQPGLSDFGRDLVDSTFVILDLETSGASPKTGAAITEIGAIKVKGGAEISRFNSLVNPNTSLPAYITELTGINDAMLANQPTINEVLPEFLDFLGAKNDSVLVAHNAPFDLSFLRYSASYTKVQWPGYKVIDTVGFARKVVEKFEVGNYKLSTLAQYFETQTSPSHRAMADVEATVDIFHKLIERVGTLDIYTLDDLLNYLGDGEKSYFN